MNGLLVSCTLLTALLILMLLSPSIGGYGFISWTWHPFLMLLGICICGVVGLFSYDPSKLGSFFGIDIGSSLAHTFVDKRRLHVVSMLTMSVFVVLGVYIAWYIHEQKDHAHFPSIQKKSVVHLCHVLGGYAFVLFIFFQVLGGFYKWWRKIRNPREKAMEGHTKIGFHLWSMGMLVILTGIILPFQKAGAYVSAFVSGSAIVVMYYITRKMYLQDDSDGYKPVATKNLDAVDTAAAIDENDTTL